MISHRTLCAAGSLVVAILHLVPLGSFAQSTHKDAPAREDRKVLPPEDLRRYHSARDNVETGGYVLLLGYPSIQSELELTNAQRREIASVDIIIGERLKAAVNSFPTQGLTINNELESLRAAFQSARLGDIEQLWIKSLSAKQIRRLRELAVQVAGPIALRWDFVQNRIGLDPDQRESINFLITNYEFVKKNKLDQIDKVVFQYHTKHMRDFNVVEYKKHVAGQSRELNAIVETIESARKETIRLLAGVLGSDQRKAFKKLGGKSIDVSKFVNRGSVELTNDWMEAKDKQRTIIRELNQVPQSKEPKPLPLIKVAPRKQDLKSSSSTHR